MAVSPTTLAHEAYVNLAGRENARFTDRGKLLSYAARAMRGLLIDFARRRQALKRGAKLEITRLDTQIDAEPADDAQLERLASELDELAALRDVSERTIQRDWEKARLILYRQVGEV